MNKKICVLMLVCMFLLVTMQGISAVEIESSDEVSNDKEINPEPSAGETAKVCGVVKCGDSEWGCYGAPMEDVPVSLIGRGRGVIRFNKLFYSDSTRTDDEGCFEFFVPVGMKDDRGNDVKFTLYSHWGAPTAYWDGLCGPFTVTQAKTYNKEIWVEFTFYSYSETEENTQDLQSSPQQFESVFSGSQSL